MLWPRLARLLRSALNSVAADVHHLSHFNGRRSGHVAQIVRGRCEQHVIAFGQVEGGGALRYSLSCRGDDAQAAPPAGRRRFQRHIRKVEGRLRPEVGRIAVRIKAYLPDSAIRLLLLREHIDYQ